MPYPLVETATPTLAQVTFLLPYLYGIQEEARTEEGSCNEKLSAAIAYAESVIIDAEYAKEGAASKLEVEQEIQKKVMKEINDADPLILSEIDEKAVALEPEYERPAKKGKWKVKSKQARDQAIHVIKEEKVGSEMARLAREICERHIKSVDKSHYSTSQTTEIRDAL
jgi:hypothetical protein